ncbi:hypothetical protein IT774_13535 [Salinimonas marina]|uniref:Uncharacterized protein n=1 Tax=Salinimonas marina TaxID=2785918 RepID=A0A7S9DWE6_9ALTE|nr:hypothetical protein [Salinimonas marina]QPG05138.1 hypothetical protein IT774_13535 [Salinimonas marina]
MIKKNIVAGLYAQIINSIIPVVSIPLLLSYLGEKDYADWIVVSLFPAYIAASDIGFSYVMCNDIFINYKNYKRSVKRAIYTTAIFFTCFVLIVIAAALLLVTLLVGEINNYSAMVSLICWGAISLYNPFIELKFKINDVYHEFLFLINSIRLIEWLVSVFLLIFTQEILPMAISLFITRLALTIFLAAYSSRFNRKVIFKKSSFDIIFIKRFYRKSILFSSFSLSNILSVQGITYVVSVIYSDALLILFNAYRTLTRFMTQLLAVINKAYWPRFSVLYGNSDVKNLKIKVHECRNISFLLLCISSIVLLIFAELAVYLWLGRDFYFDRELFTSLLFIAVLNGIWQTDWVLLMASNKHDDFAIKLFLIYATSLLGFYLSSISLPLQKAVCSVAVFEIFIIYICVFKNGTKLEIFSSKEPT